MTDAEGRVRLGEAAQLFLASLPSEERGASQQEIHRFVQWFGQEQTFDRLPPSQVANYAARLSGSDTDYVRKLELTKVFLRRARKEGWSSQNLAVHLKARKTQPRTASARANRRTVPITRQRHQELTAELTALQEKRPQLIEEIQRAAADKDFRENAPLDAAREQRGYLEGKIMELESTLAAAVIIDEKPRQSIHKVTIGDEVVLEDLASGKEVHYTLVGPNEADAASGRISVASPIGKAALGRTPGTEVEVRVPAGKLRYRVVRIVG